MKHILLTGVPGIGKTTLVKKIIKYLADSRIDLDGFITEEIRNEQHQRIGFGVRLIKSNVNAVLADKNRNHRPSPNTKNLGQYTVYVKQFEDLVLQPILTFDNGVLVIDEVGKMELFSKKFEEAVSILFKKKNIKILATVPVKSLPFVEGLKRDNNCQLITVTAENRDTLPEEIMHLLVDKK